MNTQFEFIPVNTPSLGTEEREYLINCIDSGWISSEGPYIKEFEESLAAKVSRSHGIAVANGSAALDIAVAALGIGPGDEVIMPSFTIISCPAAVVRAGAIPVVIDSEETTWNMDVTQIEAKITPNTKAIMVVHIYGLPVDMGPVLELAKRHDLYVIEDAAEMHGQTWNDKPCGSFGDISTFSFYPNKHITTGEGGMIVTDNAKLAERCRQFRNLCFLPERRFVHEELGWNYRMTNMQAAVGVAQLGKLDAAVAQKRHMGAKYNQLLANTPGLVLPPTRTSYAESIYWVYGLLLDDSVSCDADVIMRKLAERGVGSRPFFWPVHEQPVFLKKGWYQGERYPFAEKLARRGFYIPSGIALTDEQIERSARTLSAIMAELTG